MPSDYSSRLSAAQLNDIVSYVLSLPMPPRHSP